MKTAVAIDDMVGTTQNTSAVNVLKFFDLTDGLELSWAHAVNSQLKLKEALSGKSMMLEADILLCPEDGTPIMAHPPNTDSDLSLTQFLEKTVGSSKGLKLDFKETAAVEPSLKILTDQITEQHGATIPIWLNADILHGPCHRDCNDSVDPKVFLSLCAKYFPSVTLSVGWTTGNHISTENGGYDWHLVWPMKELLSNLTQPITFPIRANLIGNSIEQLIWLLGLSDEYTLTIWSGNFDTPNMKDLATLRNRVSDKTRIFYDLPLDQETKFKEELQHYR